MKSSAFDLVFFIWDHVTTFLGESVMPAVLFSNQECKYLLCYGTSNVKRVKKKKISTHQKC